MYIRSYPPDCKEHSPVPPCKGTDPCSFFPKGQTPEFSKGTDPCSFSMQRDRPLQFLSKGTDPCSFSMQRDRPLQFLSKGTDPCSFFPKGQTPTVSKGQTPTVSLMRRDRSCFFCGVVLGGSGIGFDFPDPLKCLRICVCTVHTLCVFLMPCEPISTSTTACLRRP